MNLPETGDVITPVDDPCQFNPAWRAIVAGYLFAAGIRTEDDFKTLAMSGSVTVTHEVQPEEHPDEAPPEEPKKPAKGKRTAKKKEAPKPTVRKVSRRITPFYENPEYRIFASDKWIQAQIRMMDEQAHGSRLTDDSVPVRLASRWYSEPETEAALRKRLEPLLLTEIGIDIITLDLIGLPSAQTAVDAYEKLYFNCRDENFARSPSMQLIQRMAMPWGPLKMFLHKWENIDDDGFVIGDGRPLAKESDIWKAVAATMGYESLMYLWHWEEKAHGIQDHSLTRLIELSWKASVARLFQDLYSGNIAHEDAARILASYTAQSKFLSDDRKDGGAGEDATVALMAILTAAAPKMRTLVQGGEGMISDNEIRERIASQQAIDKTAIQDAGKQVDAQVIDAQIVQAINADQ